MDCTPLTWTIDRYIHVYIACDGISQTLMARMNGKNQNDFCQRKGIPVLHHRSKDKGDLPTEFLIIFKPPYLINMPQYNLHNCNNDLLCLSPLLSYCSHEATGYISNPYFTLFVEIPGILLIWPSSLSRLARRQTQLLQVLQSLQHRFILASCICADCCYDT